MAIVVYDYQEIYDNLYSLVNNGRVLTDKISTDNWSNTLRRLMLNAQENALVGADAPAITFLRATRRFLFNNTLNNVILDYNGRRWTFGLLQCFCMHPDEWRFFKQKNDEQGLPLIDDPNGAAYFGGNGAIGFFYY